eukprot:11807364-Alexandrium_andersonii.AAC.1
MPPSTRPTTQGAGSRSRSQPRGRTNPEDYGDRSPPYREGQGESRAARARQPSDCLLGNSCNCPGGGRTPLRADA